MLDNRLLTDQLYGTQFKNLYLKYRKGGKNRILRMMNIYGDVNGGILKEIKIYIVLYCPVFIIRQQLNET